MTYRKWSARQGRTADQITARRRMQQGTHGLVLMAQGERTVAEVAEIASKTTHWWNDLRRGRLPAYGAMLRFIDMSIKLGTPKSVLLQIPALLSWYIEDQYGPTDTAEMDAVA